MARPWWAVELLRMRPALEAYLRRRAREWMAEDVVDGVITELTSKVLDASPRPSESSWVRSAWLASDEPSEDDAASFRAIVWRGLHLRSTDELRKHYVRKHAATELEEATRMEVPTVDLDAQRYLVALARRIAELSDDERALLQDFSDDSGGPKSNAERQRVFRLRRRLALLIKKDLGL